MSTTPEPWLTVAERLSLSTKAIYILVAPGCDDRIRFRASDLDAWVDSRRDAPKGAYRRLQSQAKRA
jgi:predicted DNA-binding transcriptional regulator AlpA